MKVFLVKKARSKHVCIKCSRFIEVGESYYRWNSLEKGVQCWHEIHGYPSRSYLVASEHLRKIYQTQERVLEYLQNIVNTISLTQISPNKTFVFPDFRKKILDKIINFNVTAVLAIESAHEVSEEYYVSGENMQRRFGITSQVTDCYEKGTKILQWAALVEQYAEELQELAIKNVEADTRTLFEDIPLVLSEICDTLNKLNLRREDEHEQELTPQN